MLARILLTLIFLLGSHATAQQVTPSFGLDSTGPLRNLSVRDPTLPGFVPFGILDTTTHTFVGATSPVEGSGAKGNSNGTTGNGADDTAALTACMAGGKICALRSGAIYRVTSSVVIPSGGGLVGSGNRSATIYCDPAGLTNTSGAAGTGTNQRYGPNAVCLQARGQLTTPFTPATKVTLRNFKLDLGRTGTTDARYITGIEARNILTLDINGVEVTHGPAGAGIRIASVLGGGIRNSFITDFYTNSTTLYPFGLELDNDPINAIPTSSFEIDGNTVTDILVGPATKAAIGYQADAIDLLSRDSTKIRVTNNTVARSGKGIYTSGVSNVIANNTISQIYNYSIALEHGAERNVVDGNTILNAGAVGILLTGDTTDLVRANTVSNNNINIVGDDTWTGFTDGAFVAAGTDTACIMTWPANGADLHTNNLIQGNSCYPGPTGRWAFWRGGDTSATEFWIDNYAVAGTGIPASSISGLVRAPYDEGGSFTVANGTKPLAVEAFGAKGDSNATTGNGTDDTMAINSCLATGKICALRAGATYRVMSELVIPANGGLIGPSNRRNATIYCDPAGINNTNGLIANRYLPTATCIKAQGAPGAELSGIIIKDLTIDWGGKGPDGKRCCQIINARYLKDARIENNELKNGSSNGIRFSSWTGGWIANNYIHDFTNDSGDEYSGIEGGNDGVEDFGVQITGNRIINMLVSQAGYAATFVVPGPPDGYQPNGIKLIKGSRYVVSGNVSENTGQTYDFYIDDSVIANNVANNALAFCLALKHNVKRNIVIGNNLSNCGSAGLATAGDAAPSDAVANVLIGNRITNVAVGNWADVDAGWTLPYYVGGPMLTFEQQFDQAGNDSACIFTGVNTTDTIVQGNSCDPGPRGDYAWRAGATQAGAQNYWADNFGKAGVGTQNGGYWYQNGENEPGSRHDSARITGFVPWADVAAALDTPLSGSNLINITGTGVAIQDFIYGARGQVFTIKFNGANTLRCSGGNLICPAGVGTTADGDVMALVVEIPKDARAGAGGTGGAYRILWYRKANGQALIVGGTETNAADGQLTLKRSNTTADVIPLYIANSGTIADGNGALIDASASNQNNLRSVQFGDIDKPTTGAHCFTVRTSNGNVPAERLFTCLGLVVGAPTGGTNGDMGAGINTTAYYRNGTQLPYVDAAQTWTAAQTFSALPNFTAGQTTTLASGGIGETWFSTLDTSVGISLIARHARATPTNGDDIATLYFQGNNGAGTPVNTNFAYVSATAQTVTPSSELGSLRIGTTVAGSLNERMRIGSGVTIGGAGSTLDDGAGTLHTTGNIRTDANIELANASDTTLSRASAGKLAVEGDTVATLGVANTFTGLQSTTMAAPPANIIGQWTATNDTATGSILLVKHTRATPTNGDDIRSDYSQANDSTGTPTNFAATSTTAQIVTDGSEAGYWRVLTAVAGVFAERLRIGGGLMVGASGTSDYGVGTVNVTVGYHVVPTTVGALGTCNATWDGTFKAVTDANSTTYNAVAAGGGANHMPVYCNGTNWVLH